MYMNAFRCPLFCKNLSWTTTFDLRMMILVSRSMFFMIREPDGAVYFHL